MTVDICPYCNGKVEIIDSKHIYGVSYGNMHICKPCNAYVGCQKGTSVALGRLADTDLRYYKRIAHESFDPLWERAIKQGRNKKEARGAAYKWLASCMKLKASETHIGMFDIEQCKQVIKFCKPFR